MLASVRIGASRLSVLSSGVLLLLAVCLVGPVGAAADSPFSPELPGAGASIGKESRDRRFIVVLKQSVRHPGAVAADQADEVDADVDLVYRTALKGYAATMPKSEVEALEADPRVLYVAPDRKVSVESIPTGLERIGATENAALDIDEEDDVRVDADIAVIDTGVDYQHPDLNVVQRVDCIPPADTVMEKPAECIDELGTDHYGHGTHVAGIAAALDDNEGVTGVAPGARLWGVKALNDDGWGYESWIVAGVDWVTAHASEIEVANLSIGCLCSQPALEKAIESSADTGIVYTVAAGNENRNAAESSPADNPDVITVSALADYDGKPGGEATTQCEDRGPDDTLADFSNFGETVEVAAPGVCVLSTVPGDSPFASGPEDPYATLSGTSMAAPHVAGAAAILASESNPEDLADVESIREMIEEAGSQTWIDEEREPILDVSSLSEFDPAEQRLVTLAATIVGPGKATLRGEVNPAGPTASVLFEYGPTTAYGSTTSVQVVSGYKFAAVTRTVEGLGSGIYHYRAVATIGGKDFYGPDRVFGSTPPSVGAASATEVKGWGARLQASVDPEGLSTSYYFEYGRTTAYGRSAAAATAKIGAGTDSVEVSQLVDGLDPGTTYHYRLVATSAAGETRGEDKTVATLPAEWKAQAAEDAAHPKSPEERLKYVSCPSDTSCVAVGVKSMYAGNDLDHLSVLAQHWNGSVWSTVATPSVEEEIPSLEGRVWFERVSSVSCASANWCVAVGTVRMKGSDDQLAFLYQWDGSTWSMNTAASEAIGSHDFVYFTDVSCASASMCMAVGSRVDGVDARAIAMLWDGEEWQSVPVPSPGTDFTRLDQVSCVSADSCTAFGAYRGTVVYEQGMYQHWDGEEWSVLGVGGAYYFLDERNISCVEAEAEATGCWNPMRYFDGEQWGDEYAVDDFDWWKVYAGAALGVSCTSPTACAAVGWFSSFTEPSRYRPFVTSWDGEVWSRESVDSTDLGVDLDTAVSELQSVDCSSPGVCTAVGYYTVPSVGVRPLIVRREEAPCPRFKAEAAGSIKTDSAVLEAKINPEGASTKYQFEYGKTDAYGSKAPAEAKTIEAGGDFVAVTEKITGLEAGVTYHYRVAAESSAGSSHSRDRTFTTLDLPEPITRGASGIASTSATLNARIAPGGSSASYQFEYGATTSYGAKVPASPKSIGSGTEFVPASQSLSGLQAGHTYHYRVVATNSTGTAYGSDRVFETSVPSWSAEYPPSAEGSLESTLYGLSCSASDACVAVGYYAAEGGGLLPQANSWDGAQWDRQEMPAPAESTWNVLSGVSCASEDLCAAVGVSDGQSLSEVWDGSEWRVEAVPMPPGAEHSQLENVSCVGESFCVAVGRYYPGSISPKEAIPLIARWRGSRWTVRPAPQLAGATSGSLADVSCVTASSCLALGEFSEGPSVSGSYALTWNGSGWTPAASPDGLTSVSCSAASSCVAVGQTTASGGVAASWNGAKWTSISVDEPEGFEFGGLADVSCSSKEACTAVGNFVTSDPWEGSHPYAQRWNGSAWSTQETPALFGGLEEVWCPSASACMAVGMSEYVGLAEGWGDAR